MSRRRTRALLGGLSLLACTVVDCRQLNANVAVWKEDAVSGHQGDEVFFDSTGDHNNTDEHNSQDGSSNRIVGGYDADPNQDYFYALLLEQNNETKTYHSAGCGASLISNCHVLTAAHCVEDVDTISLAGVYVGAYEPFDGNPGVDFHFSTFASIDIHPGYNPTTNQNDIAVVRMSTCLDSAAFPPINVARPGAPDLQPDDILYVLGLGRTSESSTTQVRTLQKVAVPVVDETTCSNNYSPEGYTLYNDMICAGYDTGGLDSCRGDSGGPAYIPLSGVPVLFGVVSWGLGCARPGLFGVYSSVQHNFDFIQRSVCNANDREVDGDLFLCVMNTDGYTGDQPVATPIPSPSPTPAPTPIPTVPTQVTSAPTFEPTAFCTNSGGVFSVPLPDGYRKRRNLRQTQTVERFTCDKMAPGERGHKHCWDYDAKLGTSGIHYCRASCHPHCISSDAPSVSPGQ